MHVISFSIHESLIVPTVPKKSQRMANIVPGCGYAFGSYSDYAAEYQRSTFGMTWRKAGWDCLRHYEIIANGCLPWFVDFKNTPANTLATLPKWLATDSPEMQKAWSSERDATQLTVRLLEYAREHLTCRAAAKRVLELSGNTGAERVLWVNWDGVDYLDTLTLIGMKQLLGGNCVEVLPHDWLYSDATADYSHLYGRGFTYTRHLLPEWRSTVGSLRDYDVIVWGSWTRSKEFWSEAVDKVDHRRLIRLIGEDYVWRHDGVDVPTFVREQQSE